MLNYITFMNRLNTIIFITSLVNIPLLNFRHFILGVEFFHWYMNSPLSEHGSDLTGIKSPVSEAG